MSLALSPFEHLVIERDGAVVRVANAQDHAEGVAAFFEKRDPEWSGR